MKRRKVLYVIHDVPFFLSHRWPLADAASRNGFAVHIAGPMISQCDRLKTAGFILHDIPLGRGVGRRSLGEVRAFATIFGLIRHLEPDIVHCITLKPVVVGGIVAHLLGAPAVVHAVTGLGYSFTSLSLKARLARFVASLGLRYVLRYRNATTIVQNPDDLAMMVQAGLLRPSQAKLIKGSGVDPEIFRPKSREEDPPIVLMPSRMLWDKGIGEFVEAARRLAGKGIQARFAIAGDVDPGNPNSIPPSQIEAWRREGVVELWGHRTDMPDVLAAARIVCLPSYREGVPKVLIEAAACGRPIVTTDAPGCREIVRHGENGLLVPVRDSVALADAIECLLAKPELGTRFGQRGREMVIEEFSEDRVVRETLEVYERALARMTLALSGAGPQRRA